MTARTASNGRKTFNIVQNVFYDVRNRRTRIGPSYRVMRRTHGVRRFNATAIRVGRDTTSYWRWTPHHVRLYRCVSCNVISMGGNPPCCGNPFRVTPPFNRSTS